MGYYTDFTLTAKLLESPSNPVDEKYIAHYLSNAQFASNAIKEELEALEVFEDISIGGILEGSITCWGNAKWYDHNKDMMLLSSRYRGILFTLHGVGEEDDDRWFSYYLDGKMQDAPCVMHYDDFDERLLCEEILDSGENYSYQNKRTSKYYEEMCSTIFVGTEESRVKADGLI